MKKTRKIQVLVDEDTIQTIDRIMFWERVEGISDTKSMSAYVRNLILDKLENVPNEYKQSIKNIRR
mgnify:CR=1 FL=1